MKDTVFAQLSSEEKVADLKSRILTFKHKHSVLYPEVQKKKEEIQNRDDRLRSLFTRR
tara:strand:+ start:423 stop:596 length:174 start_codon:yes stop_codon:yes gene_type:complete